PPDFINAWNCINKEAERGNSEAIYAIGTWYFHGNELVKPNKVKAFEYFKIAAGLNYPDAVYDLACSFELGEGCSQDLARAYKYYVKAAILGDRQAIYEVGRCLYYGIGTREDTVAADIWLDIAEDLGIEE
ncbi:MAG: sel1 repeat family protein, partial [Cellvibrionaceae bacterium]|nr:sel1 repeat family protein [Cellvibrionaceae bacterium]